MTKILHSINVRYGDQELRAGTKLGKIRGTLLKEWIYIHEIISWTTVKN
jgi:hypothetical protein